MADEKGVRGPLPHPVTSHAYDAGHTSKYPLTVRNDPAVPALSKMPKVPADPVKGKGIAGSRWTLLAEETTSFVTALPPLPDPRLMLTVTGVAEFDARIASVRKKHGLEASHEGKDVGVEISGPPLSPQAGMLGVPVGPISHTPLTSALP